MKTEVYVIKFVCETAEDRKKIHDAVGQMDLDRTITHYPNTTQYEAMLEDSELLEEHLEDEGWEAFQAIKNAVIEHDKGGVTDGA